MLELLQNCFTWKGRLGRADFCAGMLGLGIVVTAFMGVFWADIYFHKTPTFFGMGVPGFFVLFFLLWFLGVFIEISLFIRRFHDLGRPGIQAWYLLIPFVGLYFLVLLFFFKGVEGPQKKKIFP